MHEVVHYSIEEYRDVTESGPRRNLYEIKWNFQANGFRISEAFSEVKRRAVIKRHTDYVTNIRMIQSRESVENRL